MDSNKTDQASYHGPRAVTSGRAGRNRDAIALTGDLDPVTEDVPSGCTEL